MVKLIHVIFIDDRKDSEEFMPNRVCLALDGNVRELTLFGYVLPKLYEYGHDSIKIYRLVVKDDLGIKFLEDAFYSYWGEGFTWKNFFRWLFGANLGAEASTYILRAAGFKFLEGKDITPKNLLEEVKLYESVNYKIGKRTNSDVS